MDDNIFFNKTKQPDSEELIKVLGKRYDYWKDIHDLVYLKYPKAVSEWNFPGQKYGWSFRIKDKKRAILYLLPAYNKLVVAFVFGQKAFESILNSNIFPEIKLELQSARVFAEGRGIRMEIKNRKMMKDIEKLIDIKLAN